MSVQILACCSPPNAKSDIAFLCFCYFHVYQRLGFETLTLVTLALKLSAAHGSKGLGKKDNMFASLFRKHINQ